MYRTSSKIWVDIRAIYDETTGLVWKVNNLSDVVF